MPFDDDDDDERPGPDRLLPPDDRLWRHPSEIGAHEVQVAPPVAVASTRRLPGRSALVGACLAGAVVAFGAMWVTRPTQGVETTQTTQTIRTAATTQNASFGVSVPAKALAEKLTASVALVRVQRGDQWSSTTGLWVDDRGTVAVAAPAVEGADSIQVVGLDQRVATARLAGVDPVTGVAALVADGITGSPVAVARRSASTGDTAAVLGAGGTDAGQNTRRPTVAVVVIRSTDTRASLGGVVLHDAIEVDRAIPTDAHGGALVDDDGRLLGMVLGNTTDRDLGAAAPGATVMAAAKDLRDHGKVHRAWLGVRAVDLDPVRATLLDLQRGALLTEVTEVSPAQEAGLEVGDVITAIDDRPIDDASDLVNELAEYRPEAQATISLQRGPDRKTMPVRLGG